MTRVNLDADCDQFVLAHPRGWFWHTSRWRRYCAAFRDGIVDDSRPILWEQVMVGFLVLLRESQEYRMGDDPCPMPLVDTQGMSWFDCWQVIEALMRRHGVTVARFRDWGTPPDYFPVTHWQTLVLDLDRPATALWHDLRDSYRPLIHKIERAYEIQIDDTTGELAPAYETLHRATVGQRAPRGAGTYACQAQWIPEGYGVIVGARSRETGTWAAMAYLIRYKDRLYYASGPSAQRSVMHAVLWHAITWAQRETDCRWFELGWINHAQTQDEADVEFFKRGFGGQPEPMYSLTMRAEP